MELWGSIELSVGFLGKFSFAWPFSPSSAVFFNKKAVLKYR
jgi:hypothetical protein